MQQDQDIHYIICGLPFMVQGSLDTWCTGSGVPAHRFKCPAACGILLPRPRIELVSPAPQGRLLATGPLGKSLEIFWWSWLRMWKPLHPVGRSQGCCEPSHEAQEGPAKRESTLSQVATVSVLSWGRLDTHTLDGLGRFTGVLEVNTEISASWIARLWIFWVIRTGLHFEKKAGSLPIKPLKQKETNKHSW